MRTLHERVWRAIERSGLVSPGMRVLVAVSGGSDSVALAHLMHDVAGGPAPSRRPRRMDGDRSLVAPSCGVPTSPGRHAVTTFTLAGIAHLNHGLRGADSDADEQCCRDLAARLGLPFDSARIDVGALARHARTSIEVAARTARLAFLQEAAARLGADRVALGHTQDDQAETYLLRMLRGAGTTGLAAMAPRRDIFIRPLLTITRQELWAWRDERGLAFREDRTNADVSIPRNRVRHELLPLLTARFNPRIVDTLARNADLSRQDDAWMEEAAERAVVDVVVREPALAGEAAAGTIARLALRAETLRRLPPALGRRVARRALQSVTGLQFCSLEHVDAVLSRAATDAAGVRAADLPGVRVERIGSFVVLTKRTVLRDAPVGSWRYDLPVPGALDIRQAGGRLVARQAPWVPDLGVVPHPPDGYTAIMDAAVAAGGLAVRSREPGDTLRPLGLGGRKKLQDVLVDRKVMRADRDRVALVVDRRNRILWVTGHLLAEEARVTDRTTSVVILTFRPLLCQLGEGV